jgi:hypothetical protein
MTNPTPVPQTRRRLSAAPESEDGEIAIACLLCDLEAHSASAEKPAPPAHRTQKQTPGETKKRLDERIAGIKRAARAFLTLHGGSGTDHEDFREAIAAGINIVHINTELRIAWRRGLESGLAKQADEVVPYKFCRPSWIQ